MGRNERRRAERAGEAYTAAVDKLTPDQNKLIVKLATEKADASIAYTAILINECYFKAMRSCGIGEARANKILAQTEDLIKLEADKAI